jgi:outer membrane lipoprotein-sorting protein
MKKRTWYSMIVLCAIGLSAVVCAEEPNTPAGASEVSLAADVTDPNAIDPASPLGQLLEKINHAAKELKSCKAVVDYLFIHEPELLDSRTIRKGTLLYQKTDKGSKMRLNFDTVKQDDGDEQKKQEQYFFDGVWLTKIDFTLRQIDQYQQAPVDKPVEVFDYISHNFPIVGFSGADTLQKQFVITLVAPAKDEKKLHHLLLKVKPDSVYKDDYTRIDLWVDSELYLPVRMLSESTQGDIYDLVLSKPELNKSLSEKLFVIDAPADFSKNIKTLDEKDGKDSAWPQEL